MMTSVRDSLAAGKGVRRALPEGRLHVDRPLPFVCVYRRPPRRSDPGTEELITAQAAYLVMSGASKHRPLMAATLDSLADVARETFGELLVVEVWAGDEVEIAADQAGIPRFRVHAALDKNLESTVETLQNSLGAARFAGQSPRVERARRPISHPPGQPTLNLPASCSWIGIEVAPVWRRPTEDAFYPLILQRLRRVLSRAIQMACFRFMRSHTSHRPRHYQVLGRRAWLKAAADADAQLARVNEKFDFLLLMSPTNTDAAYERFKEAGHAGSPHFLYRHLPIDPALVKRQLWSARIERVEDPTLTELFADKQRELDLQLDALMARGSSRALLLGRLLYGGVEPSLLKEAEEILTAISANAREPAGAEVSAAEFAEAANEEVAFYRALDPGFEPKIELRDDIAGLMVSRGRLLIPRRLKVAGARVGALLQHEIGTHIVTFRNGSLQPFRLLRHGLPGYDQLQEGLAVLAEYLCGALSRPRLRMLAARVVAVDALIAGASFTENFRMLHERWNMPARAAFGVATRVHRGGGLPKDAAYLRGLRMVVDALANGQRMEPLLVGKVSMKQLPVVEELLRRHVLRPPALRPRYLSLPGAAERRALLRPGLPLLSLTD